MHGCLVIFLSLTYNQRMIMIIPRYLLREVFLALLTVTVILLLIFLSNQLVRYLSYAASGKIAASFVFRMLLFEVPYLLALLIPLGFYLGIILAYGRMYADNEMSVMQSSGVGLSRLILITSFLSVILSVVVALLTTWVNPRIESQKNKEINNDTLIGTLRPGRFQVVNDGRSVIYVEKLARNKAEASNIFIAEEPHANLSNNKNWIVLSAANGYQSKNHWRQKFIVSNDGYRYEGTPGENDYKVVSFKKYAVRLPEPMLNTSHPTEESISTSNLLHHYNIPKAASELQWRLAWPISIFVLMILGIALCRVKPRQGRFISIVPAILVYIVYVNLLFMAKSWMEQGLLPISIGMWWVHLLLLASAVLWLIRSKRANR